MPNLNFLVVYFNTENFELSYYWKYTRCDHKSRPNFFSKRSSHAKPCHSIENIPSGRKHIWPPSNAKKWKATISLWVKESEQKVHKEASWNRNGQSDKSIISYLFVPLFTQKTLLCLLPPIASQYPLLFFNQKAWSARSIENCLIRLK